MIGSRARWGRAWLSPTTALRDGCPFLAWFPRIEKLRIVLWSLPVYADGDDWCIENARGDKEDHNLGDFTAWMRLPKPFGEGGHDWLASADDWRPEPSAPRTGTDLLAWFPFTGEPRIVSWSMPSDGPTRDWCVRSADGTLQRATPHLQAFTLWTPMPERPPGA